MISKEKIVKVLFRTVDEFNGQMPKSQNLSKSLETNLYGKKGKLDSLGLVNFIVAVESALEEEFGVTVTLADERAMSLRNSPFRTIGVLADYVSSLLEENFHE